MRRVTRTMASPIAMTAAVCFAATTASGQEEPSPQESSEARVDAGAEGFALSSENGEWRLRLRGLVQVDRRVFSDGSAPDADSEWLLRRARPSFEGELGTQTAFRITTELAGGDASVVDAYIDRDFGNGLRLRAGKFKAPVGLERLQSANDLRLIERSIVTDLVPNRDVGLALLGGGDVVTWAAGVFNGVDDGRSGDEDVDGNQEAAMRVFVEPLDGDDGSAMLGFGIAGTLGNTEGTPPDPLLTSYRSPGQNDVFLYRAGADGTFADGDRARVVPQFYAYKGPVGVMGEWVRVIQDVRRTSAGLDREASLHHEAWQLTGEWVLRGTAGYRDPGQGAVQLVARISRLSVDDAAFAGAEASFADPASAVGEARTWAFGVNWFPIAGLKTSLAYHQTSFDGGAPDGDRPDEKVLLFRLQSAF